MNDEPTPRPEEPNNCPSNEELNPEFWLCKCKECHSEFVSSTRDRDYCLDCAEKLSNVIDDGPPLPGKFERIPQVEWKTSKCGQCGYYNHKAEGLGYCRLNAFGQIDIPAVHFDDGSYNTHKNYLGLVGFMDLACPNFVRR